MPQNFFCFPNNFFVQDCLCLEGLFSVPNFSDVVLFITFYCLSVPNNFRFPQNTFLYQNISLSQIFFSSKIIFALKDWFLSQISLKLFHSSYFTVPLSKVFFSSLKTHFCHKKISSVPNYLILSQLFFCYQTIFFQKISWLPKIFVPTL